MGAPEKPSLDGLEEKWAARWEADGTYRFDRSKTRDEVFAIDTPPPTVSGSLHVGTCSRTRTPTPSPGSGACAGVEVFYPMGWDDNGLPDRAPGAELLRRALRPVAAVRPRLRAARTKPREAGGPDLAAGTSSSSATAHGRGRAGVRGALAPLGLSVDWSMTYATIGEARAAGRRSARSCATSPGARRTRPRRPRCGTSTSAPPSRRRSWKTASCPAPTTRSTFARHRRRRRRRDRDHAPRADPRVRRAGRASRRRALPRAVRHRGAHAAVRRAGARCCAHPLADPEKGSGIAMICTFGDTTDVMWWRELQLPARAVVGLGRPPPARAARARGEVGVRRRVRRVRGARGQDREAGAGAHRGAAARVGRPRRRAEADHARGEVLRERRPAARDRDHRASGTSATAAATPRCASALLERGRELQLAPRRTCAVRYEHWVEGLNGDWLVSRQRFFGVPFPRLVPRSTPTASPTTTTRSCPTEDRLPVDPSSESPDGLHRGPARQAGRLRRRSRRHGHVGDVVAHARRSRAAGRTTPTSSRGRSRWTCGRRRTRSSARGSSTPSCARTSSSTRCRGPTPRSTAGSSIPTARRCRRARATSSRR